MQQADVGNAKVVSGHSVPRPGFRLKDFALQATNGKQVSLSDFRGVSNLILIFTGNVQETKSYLSQIDRERNAFHGLNSRLLFIIPLGLENAAQIAREFHLEGSVLCDPQAFIHNQVGGTNEQGGVSPAVYVTDRFGEIAALWRVSEGNSLPSSAEIIDWITYLENVCPECEPSEWPVDD